MSYLSYSNINSLEEVSFIAGTHYVLEFSIYEEDGVTPIDLEFSTVYWVLSPLGQPDYRVAKITGTIGGTSNNVITIDIPSATTETLSGKYVHQPVIISGAGAEYYPCQGNMLIVPRIPYTP